MFTRIRKNPWGLVVRPLLGVVVLVLIYGIALGSGLTWYWAGLATWGAMDIFHSFWDSIEKAKRQ